MAQKIIKDISRRKKYYNVVVKLNMIKAYDRVSWVYLTQVIRRFDFGERMIDMV